jgi:hypothetical protein
MLRWKNDPLAYTESEDWEPGRYEDLGQETVDGKPCRVLQAEEAGVVTKLYVWEEWGFPIKVETIENGGITHTMEYRNLKLNSVADSEFDLPAGVQVMETGNLTVHDRRAGRGRFLTQVSEINFIRPFNSECRLRVEDRPEISPQVAEYN